MCLGIPVKIMRIDGDEGVIATRGLSRRVNLSLMKGVAVGDYVILHAGFAIEKVKETEAKKTLKLLRELEP